MKAVIYEGLRINIPFSGLEMKEVPPGGDVINGQFVPGGTRLGVSALSVQRSKAVFGDDADLFRPERWLEGDEEEQMRMRQHGELVFGSGRWGCSGKSVAFMELNKTFVEVRVYRVTTKFLEMFSLITRIQLFRRFDMQLVDPTNPIETVNKNMFFQKNMWVRVTERFPDNPA